MRIAIIISFILSSVMAMAQLSVTGKITDPSNLPLEFATVALKQGEAFVSTVYSDEKGFYKIDAPLKGNFILTVYYVGFNTNEINLEINKDTSVNITMSVSNASNLQEITIVNKKQVVEQKVDRLVFNVENSIAATGGDALDALKITPGIAVRNETISMIGKSGMRVMVNDKFIPLSGDELINFLKSIQVSSISKIEVITNPPAKYEAEGNSGIINIKLKTTNMDSWNSFINAAYVKNTYSTGRAGAGFNYRENKFSLYSNISGSDGARQITDQSKMFYPGQIWSNKSPRKVGVSNINGNIGLNYQVSPAWEIGAQYIGDVTNYKIDNNSQTTLTNINGLIDSTIQTISNTKENSGTHSGNINSTVNLDTLGKKIIMNLDYFTYKEDNDNAFYNHNFLADQSFIEGSYYSAQASSRQQIENYSAKMDVEFPLRMINLSYGGRIASTTTNNNIVFFNTTSGKDVIDIGRTNTFRYTERNEALYLSANKKLNEKWEAQAGLRTEATQTEGFSKTLDQTNDYNYIKFFPTAYISYTPNEKHTVTLNYGRRINRPNYEQLNPFRIYSNPYFYVEGNPFLQPSFSDNLELSHTYKNLSSKLYYSNVTNGYQQLPIVDAATNTQVITVQNFYHTDLVGLNESYLFNKYDWWESANSINIYYSISTSNSAITRSNLESFNAFVSTSNDFVLNKTKTLFFNLSYWYNFPGSADLASSNGFSQLDMSLKCLLLKSKLTLSISGNDLLYTNKPVYTLYSNGVKIQYKNYYDDRSVRISLVYKFGNSNVQVDEKEVGNTDEKNRVGN